MIMSTRVLGVPWRCNSGRRAELKVPIGHANKKGLAQWQPLGHSGQTRHRLHQLLETTERRRIISTREY